MGKKVNLQKEAQTRSKDLSKADNFSKASGNSTSARKCPGFDVRFAFLPFFQRHTPGTHENPSACIHQWGVCGDVVIAHQARPGSSVQAGCPQPMKGCCRAGFSAIVGCNS